MVKIFILVLNSFIVIWSCWTFIRNSDTFGAMPVRRSDETKGWTRLEVLKESRRREYLFSLVMLLWFLVFLGVRVSKYIIEWVNGWVSCLAYLFYSGFSVSAKWFNFWVLRVYFLFCLYKSDIIWFIQIGFFSLYKL